MPVMKTPDARSPLDTNHPCAQHVGPASTPPRAIQSRLSRKASACCASARKRFSIKIRNWFGGSFRRRPQRVSCGFSEGAGLAGRAGTRKPLWSKSSGDSGRGGGAALEGRICQDMSL